LSHTGALSFLWVRDVSGLARASHLPQKFEGIQRMRRGFSGAERGGLQSRKLNAYLERGTLSLLVLLTYLE